MRRAWSWAAAAAAGSGGGRDAKTVGGLCTHALCGERQTGSRGRRNAASTKAPPPCPRQWRRCPAPPHVNKKLWALLARRALHRRPWCQDQLTSGSAHRCCRDATVSASPTLQTLQLARGCDPTHKNAPGLAQPCGGFHLQRTSSQSLEPPQPGRAQQPARRAAGAAVCNRQHGGAACRAPGGAAQAARGHPAAEQ